MLTPGNPIPILTPAIAEVAEQINIDSAISP
jgi:hypothetical protein